MNWFTKTLTSSIGKKLIMSITGLFLVLFLIEHLIGNLMLLKNDDGLAFNEFAHFMKETKIILVAEVVLFLGIISHIVQGIDLIFKNKDSRPIPYKVNNASTDTWASKYMSHLGIILLIFLIIHLIDFFSYKFFRPHLVNNVAGTEIPDLAAIVYVSFKNIYQVIFYAVSMIAVSFHLWHGFQSAFITLGVNNEKYTPFIKICGKIYSILIPLGMALVPIILFFRN